MHVHVYPRLRGSRALRWPVTSLDNIDTLATTILGSKWERRLSRFRLDDEQHFVYARGAQCARALASLTHTASAAAAAAAVCQAYVCEGL